MAQFPKLTITNAGLNMIIRSQDDHKLKFTSVRLGDGKLTSGDDIGSFTALKHEMLKLAIAKITYPKTGMAQIETDVNNSTVETGFCTRELGVFAKIDDGAEQLYGYANAGELYDYIPAKSIPIAENQIRINLITSNNANVQAVIDESIIYAKLKDVTDKLNARLFISENEPETLDPLGMWGQISPQVKH